MPFASSARCGPRVKPASALLLVAALQGPAGAQETISSVRLVADLRAASGTGTVQVEYRVAAAEPGSTVGATVLDFGSARVSNLHTGDGQPSSLTAGAGVSRNARLSVGLPDAEGVARIVAQYEVIAAVSVESRRLRVHVPVLTVDRPPGEPGPGVFVAELRVPPGWSVAEGFPSGLSATDEPGVYRVGLSVVPSVVSFRGRSDGAWRPGLSRVLEVLAGAVLLGFSLAGWRHLRGAAA